MVSGPSRMPTGPKREIPPSIEKRIMITVPLPRILRRRGIKAYAWGISAQGVTLKDLAWEILKLPGSILRPCSKTV